MPTRCAGTSTWPTRTSIRCLPPFFAYVFLSFYCHRNVLPASHAVCAPVRCVVHTSRLYAVLLFVLIFLVVSINLACFPQAVACFRMAIRTDRRHYNAWYGLGSIYHRQEKYDMAEDHFRRALRINPQSRYESFLHALDAPSLPTGSKT